MTAQSDALAHVAHSDALADRVILVTGAGRGIGRAMVLAYARHGATCVLLGRRVADLESLYDEVLAAGGPEPAIYPMDLTGAEPQHYEEMIERIDESLGRLDGVLVNAAILGTLGPMEHAEPEEFSTVMHINVTAGFFLARACIPLLRRAEDASLVFTTSGVGRTARGLWGAYAVSKFAVEGMAGVLADELRSTSVRVNCVNPGKTRTGMRAKAFPAEDPATLAAPESLEPTYLYLMSAASHGVTGESLDAQPTD